MEYEPNSFVVVIFELKILSLIEPHGPLSSSSVIIDYSPLIITLLALIHALYQFFFHITGFKNFFEKNNN